VDPNAQSDRKTPCGMTSQDLETLSLRDLQGLLPRCRERSVSPVSDPTSDG
jgi:hypothetical protein